VRLFLHHRETSTLTPIFGNGATQAIDAKFNEAANFNGSDSYVSLPLGVNKNNNFSWSFWIKFDSMTQYDTPIGFFMNGSTNFIDMVSVGQLGFWDNNSRLNTPTNTFAIGNWYHVVLTKSSTAGRKFYVNGSEVSSDSVNTNSGGSTGGRNLLGAYSSGGNPTTTAFELNGKLDQVRIFNTAITAAQVTDLWTNETTTTAATLDFPAGAGCIAAYQLDGNGNDISNTYNGTTTNVGYTGLQFQPDLVWIKERSNTSSHNIADSVRGSTKYISSDLANGENNLSSTITSFDSNGFSVGNDGGVNQSAQTYVAWCFKAAASTTTIPASGSQISSDVRANVDAGFSVVKYTGTGSTATVGHGLGSVPKLILTKVVSANGNSWACYSEETGIDNYLELNTTDAKQFASNYWGSAVPTTSVFGVVDANFNNNVSGANIIAYCFADISGYQKVGSYSGGSTNVISTGFTPRFLMVKKYNASGTGWYIFDAARNPSNPRDLTLFANTSAAEAVEGGFYKPSFVTDGFSWPFADGSGVNASGGLYIYLAIA